METTGELVHVDRYRAQVPTVTDNNGEQREEKSEATSEQKPRGDQWDCLSLRLLPGVKEKIGDSVNHSEASLLLAGKNLANRILTIGLDFTKADETGFEGYKENKPLPTVMNLYNLAIRTFNGLRGRRALITREAFVGGMYEYVKEMKDFDGDGTTPG